MPAQRTIAWLVGELTVQPGTSLCPLAADGDRRHPDHLRDLLQAEAAEEPQLDDVRLAWVTLGQCAEGVIYRHEITGAIGRHMVRRPDVHDLDAAPIATFLPPAGDVNEDVPHQPRRHRDEVGPVLPAHVAPVHQADERFVHQGCGLKHVPRTLAPEVPASQLAKLRVDERHELVEGRIVSFSPGDEQLRDLHRPARCRGEGG